MSSKMLLKAVKLGHIYVHHFQNISSSLPKKNCLFKILYSKKAVLWSNKVAYHKCKNSREKEEEKNERRKSAL